MSDEARRIVDRLHAHQDFGLNLLVQLHVHLEGGLHAAHQRLDLDALRDRSGDLFDLDEEELVGLREALDARAALPFDEHLHGAVGQPEQLHHRAERADLEDVVRRRLVGLRVLLRGEEDLLVARHRRVERVDAIARGRRRAGSPCAGTR